LSQSFELDPEVLRTQTNPHFMQSDAWGSFKTSSAWTPGTISAGNASIALRSYTREADGFGTLIHLPRVSGITVDNAAAFSAGIKAHKSDAYAIKLEIYQPRDEQLLEALQAQGWVGARSTQYRYGVTAELNEDPEVAFALLKKRARTEVRQGIARGIKTYRAEATEELTDALLKMMEAMGERSRSFVRSSDYLLASWNTFIERGQGSLYFAEVEDRIVAGAFVIEFGHNAFYKDAGSYRVESTLPVGRALQWHIIEDLGKRGFKNYDLGNIPHPDEPSESMAGLLTFKTGFSKDFVEYMPALELPIGDRAEEWRRVEPEFIKEYRATAGDSFY
jgi:lipid II:glycine glycyltransferase (peptidoglycan interpeptide bridge formation enzyme)